MSERPRGGSTGQERASQLAPGAWLRLGLLFYGVLAAVAWLWRSGLYGEPLLLSGPGSQVHGVRDVALGLAAGALVVGISGPLSRTGSGRALARSLAAALGRLPVHYCLALALASGIGEELFFRGALQPRVGWLAASVLFAAAHFVPRSSLWVWSLFALGAGLLLGGLFEWTGNLVAPVVAHVAINAINLVRLVRLGREQP